MLFQTYLRRTSLPLTGEPGSFLLRYDNWDDFGFSTLFDLYYFDDSGERLEIGPVKIMRRGQTPGAHAAFPSAAFDELDEEWCSLGQGQIYYEAVYSLPPDRRRRLLEALRDCAHDLAILAEFEDEPAFDVSLLRGVRKYDISRLFNKILLGIAAPTPFYFRFNVPPGGAGGIEVRVVPDSRPPSNVHVLIGRNGVGKTRLLSGLVDNLTGRRSGSVSVEGEVTFPDAADDDKKSRAW